MTSGTEPSSPLSATSAAPPRASFGATVKAVLPWMVAAIALLWVVRKVLGLPPEPAKIHALVEVFSHVHLGSFVIVSIVLLTLNCAADSLAMLYTFRWFGCVLPYREIFVARASTYILAVVQYYVGQLAIIHFLHTRRGVPYSRAGGWIVFISGINLGVLVLLAAVGFAGADVGVAWLEMVPLGVGAGALCYGVLLRIKPRFLVAVPLLAPLFEMGVVGHLKAIAIRLPHVLVLVVWHFVALRMFGVTVPPFTALVLLPAVFFAAALPAGVQGLGLSQLAAVQFFTRYSSTGQTGVLAYSLAMTTVSLVVQVVMGLLFLPAGRKLGLSKEELSEDINAAQAAGARGQ